MSEVQAILEEVTTTPDAARYELYRWCDYAELRCLTHQDKRFSRDGLAEALNESREISGSGPSDGIDPASLEPAEPAFIDEEVAADAEELLSVRTFRQLQWRASAFGESWPFVIDNNAQEIRLKPERGPTHVLYLQLLLSSLLRYCPHKRRHEFTGRFEFVSLHVFATLMPSGSEVHRFGAGKGERFTGRLYEKLLKLTSDIRADFRLVARDFPANDVGDHGLDLVAWHDLKDSRDNIPVALAQCGCTVSGWPNKMLEASPARLRSTLTTGHPWATYYFMPLDLAEDVGGKMIWQQRRDVGEAIVIDRLRLVRLADAGDLESKGILASAAVEEAAAMAIA